MREYVYATGKIYLETCFCLALISLSMETWISRPAPALAIHGVRKPTPAGFSGITPVCVNLDLSAQLPLALSNYIHPCRQPTSPLHSIA